MFNYYEILELNGNGVNNEGVPYKEEEIKKAYKKLALKWHPDKNKDPSATNIFRNIDLAYKILSDAEQRQSFDDSLRPSRFKPRTERDVNGEERTSFLDGKLTPEAMRDLDLEDLDTLCKISKPLSKKLAQQIPLESQGKCLHFFLFIYRKLAARKEVEIEKIIISLLDLLMDVDKYLILVEACAALPKVMIKILAAGEAARGIDFLESYLSLCRKDGFSVELAQLFAAYYGAYNADQAIQQHFSDYYMTNVRVVESIRQLFWGGQIDLDELEYWQRRDYGLFALEESLLVELAQRAVSLAKRPATLMEQPQELRKVKGMNAQPRNSVAKRTSIKVPARQAPSNFSQNWLYAFLDNYQQLRDLNYHQIPERIAFNLAFFDNAQRLFERCLDLTETCLEVLAKNDAQSIYTFLENYSRFSLLPGNILRTLAEGNAQQHLSFLAAYEKSFADSSCSILFMPLLPCDFMMLPSDTLLVYVWTGSEFYFVNRAKNKYLLLSINTNPKPLSSEECKKKYPYGMSLTQANEEDLMQRFKKMELEELAQQLRESVFKSVEITAHRKTKKSNVRRLTNEELQLITKLTNHSLRNEGQFSITVAQLVGVHYGERIKNLAIDEYVAEHTECGYLSCARAEDCSFFNFRGDPDYEMSIAYIHVGQEAKYAYRADKLYLVNRVKRKWTELRFDQYGVSEFRRRLKSRVHDTAHARSHSGNRLVKLTSTELAEIKSLTPANRVAELLSSEEDRRLFLQGQLPFDQQRLYIRLELPREVLEKLEQTESHQLDRLLTNYASLSRHIKIIINILDSSTIVIFLNGYSQLSANMKSYLDGLALDRFSLLIAIKTLPKIYLKLSDNNKLRLNTLAVEQLQFLLKLYHEKLDQIPDEDCAQAFISVTIVEILDLHRKNAEEREAILSLYHGLFLELHVNYNVRLRNAPSGVKEQELQTYCESALLRFRPPSTSNIPKLTRVDSQALIQRTLQRDKQATQYDNNLFLRRMQLLCSLIALRKDLPWLEVHFSMDSTPADSAILRQEAEKISASSGKKMNIQALRDDLKVAFPHGVQVWIYASAEEASDPWAIKDRQEYAARARLFCAAGSLVMRWVPDKKQQVIYLEALTTLYQEKKRIADPVYAEQVTREFQIVVLDWLEKLPELSFIYRPHLAQALVYQEMHQETPIKEMQWPEDYSGDAYREAQRAVQQDIMILRAHAREQSTDYDWEYSARKRSPAQRLTQPIQTSQGGISFAVTEKNAMLPKKSVRVTLAKAATSAVTSSANLSVGNVENEETSLAARYAHETSGWKAQLQARTVPVVFGTIFSGGATTIGILMAVGMLSLTGWGLLGLVFCAAVTAIIVLGASYREYQSRQAVKQLMVEKPLQLEEVERLEIEEERAESLTAESAQEFLESPMVAATAESQLDIKPAVSEGESQEKKLESQAKFTLFVQKAEANQQRDLNEKNDPTP